MRVLIFGSSGQLGQALRLTAIRDTEVIYASHRDCDISNQQAVIKLMDAVEPDFVINCAAYTAVDRAEEEVEYCYLINALAPQIIAKCCSRVQTRRLIHISTDYVFGRKYNKIPWAWCRRNIGNIMKILGGGKAETRKISSKSLGVVQQKHKKYH